LCIFHGLCIIVALQIAHLTPKAFLSAIVISVAMGVQNSLTSMYAPMTTRTSHVTGTVLDVGTSIGQMIRNRNLDSMWKLKYHGANVVSFWLGAICGTLAFVSVQDKALYINSGITMSVGALTYILFQAGACTFNDGNSIEMESILLAKERPTSNSFSSNQIELEKDNNNNNHQNEQQDLKDNSEQPFITNQQNRFYYGSTDKLT